MSLIVTSLAVIETGHALPLVRGVPREVARLALVHAEGTRPTSCCGCDNTQDIGGGYQLLQLEGVKILAEVAHST
jgi:hypothetical protein